MYHIHHIWIAVQYIAVTNDWNNYHLINETALVFLLQNEFDFIFIT